MTKRAFLTVAVPSLLLGFLGASIFQLPVAGQANYAPGQLKIQVAGKDGKTTTLDFNKVWPQGIQVRGAYMTRTDKGGKANVDISADGLSLHPSRGEGPEQYYRFENIYWIDILAMCASPVSTSTTLSGTWSSNYTADQYEISQSGSAFTWVRKGTTETAKGTINGDKLSVTWTGGPVGTGSATATVTVDANGRPTSIRFSNRAVFTRVR